MSPLSTPSRRRATFHPLRVVDVERLTEAAAAITFEVPTELAEEFTFEPGQHLTLRADIDGVDVRRSYSICLPGAARPPGAGCRLQGAQRCDEHLAGGEHPAG